MAVVASASSLPLFHSHTYTALAILIAFVAIAVIRSRTARLQHVPGPWLSRYTDLLRAFLAMKYSGQEVNLYMELHSKYGDVVRVGPRSVSVLDPQAIPTIYGVKARLNKGPNVKAFNVPGIPQSILAIIDEEKHARFRRPIQGAYSLTNLKDYEAYVDITIEMLLGALDLHAKEGQAINLSLWVYYCNYEETLDKIGSSLTKSGSYDTIGKLTFGQPSGYLTSGKDFNGLIYRQKQFLEYVNVVSQMPSLHNILANNPIFKIIPHGTADFIRFAQERVDDRLAKYDPENTSRPDLLSHFIAARETYPEVVTDKQVLIYGLTNVIAGSLSTSHVLDEIVKYLTTHPDAQQRIHDEINDGTRQKGSTVSFDEAKKSSYLEGVILEGFRIHSVANLSSERVVGPDGMQLPNGVVLPPGTYVGINPAALNRRPDVFGDHPHNFDPLRWLKHDNETEEEYQQRRLQMDRATLTFGHGSRSCLGKNIVQLEVFKLIATLCSYYEFEAVGTMELFKVHTRVRLRTT